MTNTLENPQGSETGSGICHFIETILEEKTVK